MGMSIHQNNGPYEFSIEFIKDEDKLKVFKIKHEGFTYPTTDDTEKLFDDWAGNSMHSQCVHGGDIIFKSFGRVIVILSEIKENGTGTSVTNMFESIATMVYNKLLKNVKPKNITWVEYYPCYPEGDRDLGQFTSFGRRYEKVNLDFEKPGRFLNDVEFSKPSWTLFKNKKIKSYFHSETDIPHDYLKR